MSTLTRESSIEQRVVHHVEHVLRIPMPKFAPPRSSGWPDRIVLLPGGHPLFAEFKRPGAAPRPLQEYMAAKLCTLGYRVETFDDAAEAIAVITEAVHAVG